MNDFDRYIKKRIEDEEKPVPDSVKMRIEATLEGLPAKRSQRKPLRFLPKIAAGAVCCAFVVLFLLPNVSIAYAQALEKIPVIGNIVEVITIRNYFYADDKHELDVDVPKIEADDSEAADLINKDVNEMTSVLVNQFYKDIELSENNGYGSIHVDYEVVTNTARWFTLKLSVSEIAASSNNYYVYYHIDRNNGKIVELIDLFDAEKYSEVLVAEIKRQMEEQMKADDSISYLTSDGEIGEKFAAVSPDTNFYWNIEGDLVIVFDEYEIAPGSMGTPEFVIGKDVIKDILKKEYRDIKG